MAYIYALCDPDTEDVRYIGKANDVAGRLKSHLNEKSTTRKARWIQSLKRKGLKPSTVVLEEVSSDMWEDAEIRWIAHYRSLGCDLCNHTDGGDGLNNPTEDTRRKIGAWQRAEWDDPVKRERRMSIMQSPERRAKISAAHTGKKKSAQHVANLPQNQAGRKLSPEHAEKSRLALREHGYRHPKGIPMTDEVKTKISEALRGNSHTLGRVMPDAEKQQRSDALKGKPKTPEHREKLRVAALTRWQKAREK